MSATVPNCRTAHVKVIAIALIIVAGLVAYGNSIGGQFVWDDQFLVKDNVYIKNWSNLSKIFSEDIAAGGREHFSSYRPLQMLTYMVDHALWKLGARAYLFMGSRGQGALHAEPPAWGYPSKESRGQGAPYDREPPAWVYHITNIILHIMVALCIWWLIAMLFGDALLAFLTAVFFVVHPIHTGAVSYISGRADPLVTLFMLLAFIFYVKTLTVPMAISYILALLSRESSLILPCLVLVYHATFERKITREPVPLCGTVQGSAPQRNPEKKEAAAVPQEAGPPVAERPRRFTRAPFALMALLSLIYIVFRFTALRSLLAYTSYDTTVLQRLPGFFVALAAYVRLLVLPLGLHMEYGKQLFFPTHPKVIAGIAVAAVSLVMAVRMRNRSRPAFFSLCWFFTALAPQSGLYPINAYMAEHWLYLPSLGFFLLLARGVRSLYGNARWRLIGIASALLLTSFYSTLTVLQNHYWREPIAFYEKTLACGVRSARICNNLGILYKQMGMRDKAIAFYRRAIVIDPRLAHAYNDLGLALAETGDKEQAIALYKKAIELEPRITQFYNNLGLAYRDIKDFDEAKRWIEKSVEIDPRYAEGYNNLGGVYYSMRNFEKALELFKKSADISPHLAGVRNNIGLAYTAMGRRDEAIAEYKNALELDPHFADAWNNLGIAYGSTGRHGEAVTAFTKVIGLNARHPKAYYNLGLAYTATGRNDEAIRFFKKAIEVDPQYAIAYNNVAVLYYNAAQYQLAIEYCDKAQALGFANQKLLDVLVPYRKDATRQE